MLGAAEEGRIRPYRNPTMTRNAARLAAMGPYRSSGSTPSLRNKGKGTGTNPMHTKGGRRRRTQKQKGGDEMSIIFAIAAPLAKQVIANGGNFSIPTLITQIMSML